MNSELLPKVCIIVPTFNRAEMLGQTIASALAQNYPNLEVLIADNASSDSTEKVVEPYTKDRRLRYIRNEVNIGMVNNWRQAIENHTCADWFMLLSDDDWLIDATYLTRAMTAIQQSPSVKLIYANGFVMNESKRQSSLLNLQYSGIVPGVRIFEAWGTCTPIEFMLCNVLFERNSALECGPFKNPNNLSSDSELVMKMALSHDVLVFNEPVAVYRLHGANLVDKILKNLDFSIGNLDAFIEPYKLAVSVYGVNSDVVRKHLKYSQTIPYLRMMLLMDTRNHQDTMRDIIFEKIPELMVDLESCWKFKMKKKLIKHLPKLFDSVVLIKGWFTSFVTCLRA